MSSALCCVNNSNNTGGTPIVYLLHSVHSYCCLLWFTFHFPLQLLYSSRLPLLCLCSEYLFCVLCLRHRRLQSLG